MIRQMTIADYEKVFYLWKCTDGMGLRRQQILPLLIMVK